MYISSTRVLCPDLQRGYDLAVSHIVFKLVDDAAVQEIAVMLLAGQEVLGRAPKILDCLRRHLDSEPDMKFLAGYLGCLIEHHLSRF